MNAHLFQSCYFFIFKVSHNSILTPKSQDNGSGKCYMLLIIPRRLYLTNHHETKVV